MFHDQLIRTLENQVSTSEVVIVLRLYSSDTGLLLGIWFHKGRVVCSGRHPLWVGDSAPVTDPRAYLPGSPDGGNEWGS